MTQSFLEYLKPLQVSAQLDQLLGLCLRKRHCRIRCTLPEIYDQIVPCQAIVGVPFDVGLNVTTKTSSIFKQDLNGMTLKIFGDHQRSIPEAERLTMLEPKIRRVLLLYL